MFEEISVNTDSSVAVYVQIENHIMFAIASGRLKAGDQLPSVVELSKRVNVNANTVAKAYRDLEVMGLIFSRRGVGVFLAKGIEARTRKRMREHVARRLYEVVAEAKAVGVPYEGLAKITKECYRIADSPYDDTPQAIAKLAAELK